MRLNSLTRSIPPLWLLVLLALALWGGEFARRGLWEPDEARYAYVAREMRQGGHWFVPHINGVPYPDKPPLMFWLALPGFPWDFSLAHTHVHTPKAG
jgi:4-amino-4-deoxy-L-arabinose transferase-like glycosyltransferase